MSDLTGLAAISALFLTSAFVLMIITRMINALGDQIVTGFIRDHPIPVTQRWLMLYSRWLSYVVFAVGALLFLALAAAMIAGQAGDVGDADGRLLGYVAAFLLVLAGANWVLQGIVQFISYRSILRQAEAD